MSTSTIGILTGGGDVPGLNSVLKAAAIRCAALGSKLLGIRRGWEGLTQLDPNLDSDHRYLYPLNPENTRTIDRTGGTVLHTSRTNPERTGEDRLPSHLRGPEKVAFRTDEGLYDLTPLVLENLERLGVGSLIVVGGDDTLSYAARLSREGLPVIGIPKTMDNDVQGTEYCIGFSTAVSRAAELITRQRTVAGSHERIVVFRIFGRDSGHTALHASLASSTRCLIPEHPFELDRLFELLREDRNGNSSKYALVVVSEGATWKGREVREEGKADPFGNRKKANVGEELAEEIRKGVGAETVAVELTYDLRAGAPDAWDHIIATTFANIALDLLSEEVSGRMVCIQDGRYGHTTIPDKIGGPRLVQVETLYDTQRYRPNYLRKLGMPMHLSCL